MKEDEIDWDMAWWQPDYKHWINHELLTLIEISFISAGEEPVSYREFRNKSTSFKRPYEITIYCAVLLKQEKSVV